MKLLIDEMISATVAEILRERGHDAVAVVEHRALRGLSDPDLFRHAQEEARAIVTYNRADFLALDLRYRHDGREHHGIIILHPRRFPQGTATIGPLAAALAAIVTTGNPYPSFVHWLASAAAID